MPSMLQVESWLKFGKAMQLESPLFFDKAEEDETSSQFVWSAPLKQSGSCEEFARSHLGLMKAMALQGVYKKQEKIHASKGTWRRAVRLSGHWNYSHNKRLVVLQSTHARLYSAHSSWYNQDDSWIQLMNPIHVVLGENPGRKAKKQLPGTVRWAQDLNLWPQAGTKLVVNMGGVGPNCPTETVNRWFAHSKCLWDWS